MSILPDRKSQPIISQHMHVLNKLTQKLQMLNIEQKQTVNDIKENISFIANFI